MTLTTAENIKRCVDLLCLRLMVWLIFHQPGIFEEVQLLFREMFAFLMHTLEFLKKIPLKRVIIF